MNSLIKQNCERGKEGEEIGLQDSGNKGLAPADPWITEQSTGNHLQFRITQSPIGRSVWKDSFLRWNDLMRRRTQMEKYELIHKHNLCPFKKIADKLDESFGKERGT